MQLLMTILNTILQGIPLMKSIKELIVPTKIIVPSQSSNNGIEAQKIPVDASPLLQKIAMLIVEFASVYFCVYIMKKFGITYNDIQSLFGLLK